VRVDDYLGSVRDEDEQLADSDARLDVDVFRAQIRRCEIECELPDSADSDARHDVDCRRRFDCIPDIAGEHVADDERGKPGKRDGSSGIAIQPIT
jgi:hypothetical protein